MSYVGNTPADKLISETDLDVGFILPIVHGGTGQTTDTPTLNTANQVLTNKIINAASNVIVNTSTYEYLTSISGADTILGTANANITTYIAGQTFRFVAVGANTGAATININSMGAKAITKSGSTALNAGDIASGALVQISYDGTRFQLVSGAGGGSGAVYENANTIIADYTITTGKNAMSAGPIEVSSGVTVTVPAGSVWTVV